MNSVNDNLFKINIYTPTGLCFSEYCDCVTFHIRAGKEDGDFGSYGVKRGHADAVFSIGEGLISIKRDANMIFSAKSSEGFAIMDKGILNITVEKILE